jgi:hypothetical protein
VLLKNAAPELSIFDPIIGNSFALALFLFLFLVLRGLKRFTDRVAPIIYLPLFTRALVCFFRELFCLLVVNVIRLKRAFARLFAMLGPVGVLLSDSLMITSCRSLP